MFIAGVWPGVDWRRGGVNLSDHGLNQLTIRLRITDSATKFYFHYTAAS